jgi:hypothetical protein
MKTTRYVKHVNLVWHPDGVDELNNLPDGIKKVIIKQLWVPCIPDEEHHYYYKINNLPVSVETVHIHALFSHCGHVERGRCRYKEKPHYRDVILEHIRVPYGCSITINGEVPGTIEEMNDCKTVGEKILGC